MPFCGPGITVKCLPSKLIITDMICQPEKYFSALYLLKYSTPKDSLKVMQFMKMCVIQFY